MFISRVFYKKRSLFKYGVNAGIINGMIEKDFLIKKVVAENLYKVHSLNTGPPE
ncbi:TPA: hypothetical protein ICA47_004388 [Escherichia coli]|nr:hypothetical protein [Escherichia coli]